MGVTPNGSRAGMTLLALASSAAASLIAWPTTANAAVQLQGSFSERLLSQSGSGAHYRGTIAGTLRS